MIDDRRRVIGGEERALGGQGVWIHFGHASSSGTIAGRRCLGVKLALKDRIEKAPMRAHRTRSRLNATISVLDPVTIGKAFIKCASPHDSR